MARGWHEAHGGERAAQAVRLVDLHAQRQAMEPREARHRPLRPRRLVGEYAEIVRRREVTDAVAFVGREVFRRALYRDVAPGALEARHRQALVDMLSVVPLVEIAFVARFHLAEYDQHALAA